MAKLFRLGAEAYFRAENVNDACRQIGEYYLALSRNEEPESMFLVGDAEVRPAKLTDVAATGLSQANKSE